MRIKILQPLIFDLLIGLTACVFFAFIVLVLLALAGTTSLHQLWHQIHSSVVLSCIWISLETSLVVACLTFLCGLPIAYLLALKDFKGKVVLDSLIDLPIVIPPLVTGLALLVILGGDGLIGRILNRWGIGIIFTKKGIIIAQLFVAAPFFIKTAKESISAIPQNLLAASATLGASPFYTFRYLILPLSKNGLLAGLVMSWSRALGEFGATAMVAGCIPRKTETMTIAIYMQAMGGDLVSATTIALILVAFSFFSLLIFKISFRRKDEYRY